MTSQDLIQKLSFDSDADIRRRAAEELISQSGDAESIIRAFVSGLTDSDKGVRDICALGLEQLYKDMTLQKAQAVASLITHQNIELRNLAGDILLKFGNYGADALYEYLRDPRADNRKFACDIIGLSGNVNAAESVAMLLDDDDVNVRCAAIEALGYLRATPYLQPIIAMYEKDEGVRPYIVNAVGNIGGNEAQTFLLNLMNASEVDSFLQITTIDALSSCADDITIAHRLLQSLPNAELEIQLILLKAVYTIAFRLNTSISLPDDLRDIARQAMTDEDPETRIAGLLALGHTFYEEDISVLLHEIKTDHPDTQKHILSILLSQSSAEVVSIFFDKLFDVLNDSYSQLVELLGFLVSLWGNVTSDNAQTVLESIVRHYAEMPSEYQKEMVEFLLSVKRDVLIELLQSELRSDVPQRIEDALFYIECYSIRELFDSREPVLHK